MFGPLLDVQMSFRVAGARDSAPCQKWAKNEGFVAFPKTMAGVGHVKRICKEMTASYQCVLWFFRSTSLKYCDCHDKLMPGHTKCCTCHAKSSSPNWRSDAPKCNPSQEISARPSKQLWWTCLLYCACHGVVVCCSVISVVWCSCTCSCSCGSSCCRSCWCNWCSVVYLDV